MIVFLSIDSVKMKRKQTFLTPFLDKKVGQGKAIYIKSARRSNVTVYTLKIRFRIDEQPIHHDSGNEGLMTLTSTMMIY